MSVKPNRKETLKKEPIPHYGKPPVPEMTARIRSKMPDFIAMCIEHGVEPTKRQAAKYNARNGKWAPSRALN